MNTAYLSLMVWFACAAALPGAAAPRQTVPPRPPAPYRLVLLPLAEAYGINDAGQVVGIRYAKHPYTP